MDDPPSFIEFLRRSLESSVKEVLTEEVVTAQINKFEKELRKSIEPLIDSITFTQIEKVRSVARMRDELNVYIKYNKEKADG